MEKFAGKNLNRGNPLYGAKWIKHSLPDEGSICPVFYRDVTDAFCRDGVASDERGAAGTSSSDIIAATLYVTALGIYEAAINGKKIGDAYFAPGWTAYEKGRLQYQEYDVSDTVRETISGGDGLRLSITVAPGWYAGYLNGEGQRHIYGDRVAALAVLEISLADGRVLRVCTDESWRVATGIVRSAEFYHGESRDLTVRDVRVGAGDGASGSTDDGAASAGCGTVGSATDESAQIMIFDDAHSEPAPVPQECEPVRVTERIDAKSIFVTPKGELVIDFGQNHAGFVEARLPNKADDRKRFSLHIFHAEALDKYGNFYTENLRTAKATDTYIYYAAQADTTVHPEFTYHGYRYIRLEMSEYDGETKPRTADGYNACGGVNITRSDDGSILSVNGEPAETFISRFTSLALHSDMKRIGTFHCDNEAVNRLHENIVWGMRSNFVDIPTDCPQRDERLGWTGDAQIFSRIACRLYDTKAFYTKWLRDMAAESDMERGVPHLVPDITGGSIGTSVWGDAAAVIPWELYMAYGDRELLREHYPLMRLWVDYVAAQCGENVLWQGDFQRGDWLGLDAPQCLPGSMNGGTDRDLVANIYYAISVRNVRDAAKELSLSDDAEKYDDRYNHIVQAISEEYITRTGRLVSETQTACALLLHFNLLDEKQGARVKNTLRDILSRTGNHLTTGFVGTAYLLHALSENGMHDLATEVFFKKDYPGWFYAIERGATTIWERWDSVRPDGSFDESGMNSLNHYTYGSAGDWLYGVVAGITPVSPGYRKMLISPHLTVGMTEAEAAIETPFGRVSSSWSCKAHIITVEVELPEGTEATLILPDSDERIQLAAGVHRYEYHTEISTEARKYGESTMIGELLESEETAEIFYRCMPGMKDSPMLGFISKKTIAELAAMSADSAPALRSLLEELG